MGSNTPVTINFQTARELRKSDKDTGYLNLFQSWNPSFKSENYTHFAPNETLAFDGDERKYRFQQVLKKYPEDKLALTIYLSDVEKRDSHVAAAFVVKGSKIYFTKTEYDPNSSKNISDYKGLGAYIGINKYLKETQGEIEGKIKSLNVNVEMSQRVIAGQLLTLLKQSDEVLKHSGDNTYYKDNSYHDMIRLVAVEHIRGILKEQKDAEETKLTKDLIRTNPLIKLYYESGDTHIQNFINALNDKKNRARLIEKGETNALLKVPTDKVKRLKAVYETFDLDKSISFNNDINQVHIEGTGSIYQSQTRIHVYNDSVHAFDNQSTEKEQTAIKIENPERKREEFFELVRKIHWTKAVKPQGTYTHGGGPYYGWQTSYEVNSQTGIDNQGAPFLDIYVNSDGSSGARIKVVDDNIIMTGSKRIYDASAAGKEAYDNTTIFSIEKSIGARKEKVKSDLNESDFEASKDPGDHIAISKYLSSVLSVYTNDPNATYKTSVLSLIKLHVAGLADKYSKRDLMAEKIISEYKETLGDNIKPFIDSLIAAKDNPVELKTIKDNAKIEYLSTMDSLSSSVRNGLTTIKDKTMSLAKKKIKTAVDKKMLELHSIITQVLMENPNISKVYTANTSLNLTNFDDDDFVNKVLAKAKELKSKTITDLESITQTFEALKTTINT